MTSKGIDKVYPIIKEVKAIKATNVLSKATGNFKISKNEKSNKYIGSYLSLSPSDLSGFGNVCPWASAGCKKTCLNTSGHGRYTNVQASRIRKTKMFYENKTVFFDTLFNELLALTRSGIKLNKKTFCRLNTTSDITWENFKVYVGKNVFEMFPDIQFYDYSANIDKAINNTYANYHLTFSRKENNHEKVMRALENNINVAVVFSTKRGEKLPKTFLGRKVLDGDITDLRFLEGTKGLIIGLRAKGKALHDKSGFVVNVTQEVLLESKGV